MPIIVAKPPPPTLVGWLKLQGAEESLRAPAIVEVGVGRDAVQKQNPRAVIGSWAARPARVTMYARLWWSTLFGGTLTLGCWRSGRPD